MQQLGSQKLADNKSLALSPTTVINTVKITHDKVPLKMIDAVSCLSMKLNQLMQSSPLGCTLLGFRKLQDSLHDVQSYLKKSKYIFSYDRKRQVQKEHRICE